MTILIALRVSPGQRPGAWSSLAPNRTPIACRRMPAYRIIRIRGRSDASRRARLQATQAWMGRQGWQLVEYAEEARRAMFEPVENREEPSILSAPPWKLPPLFWSGLAEEWLIPRNLILGGLVVLVLGALIVTNALQNRVDPREAAESIQERWWIVDADGLNIREQPNTDASVVGRFERGQRVLVGDSKDGWVQVIQPEHGWVSSKFVRPPAPEQ